jgi:hypothetical protein
MCFADVMKNRYHRDYNITGAGINMITRIDSKKVCDDVLSIYVSYDYIKAVYGDLNKPENLYDGVLPEYKL